MTAPAPWSIGARWSRMTGFLVLYDPDTGESVEVATHHLRSDRDKTDLRWAFGRAAAERAERATRRVLAPEEH